MQGTVEIRTPDTDVGSGLVVLPETLVSKNINLAERCALRLSGDVFAFQRKGQSLSLDGSALRKTSVPGALQNSLRNRQLVVSDFGQ